MKKRILSMLLLVAMIVTAVPVMSTAAGAETSSTATEYGDYRDLYVKDGLVDLYTAYVGDTSVNLSTGTWASALKGDTTATLGNKQYWVKGALGGVGVTQIWGSYIDGVFAADSETALQYNTSDVQGTRLEFGIDKLPLKNFTVEYVAKYGETMAVDANGNPVAVTWAVGSVPDKDAAGNYLSQYGPDKTAPVDQVGNLWSYALKRDGAFWNGMRGEVVWTATNARWGSNTWNAGANKILYKAGEIFQTRGSVMTFDITREVLVDVVEEVETESSVYALYKNAALYMSATSTQCTTAEERDGDNNDRFYLAERLTINFYAVRIYDKVLTAEEMAQNKMADVLGYYGIQYLDIEAVNNLINANASTIAAYSLTADASEYAANKAELQALIDEGMTDYLPYELYAKDGMVGLFTAFDGADDETVDLTAKTWANRVYGSNHKASLSISKGAWKSGDFGGIGFDILLGEVDDNGVYTTTTNSAGLEVPTSTFSSLNYPYTYLNLGVSLLPDSDYTVDYLALYRHLYVADLEDSTAAGTGVPAKDANGNYLNAQDIPNAASSPDARTWDTASGVFSEMLGNFVGQHQKLGLGDAWGGGAWAVRWGNASTHYNHSNASWFSGIYSASGALHNGPSDPLQQNGVLQSYSYTRDETATTYTVTETVEGVETEVEKAGFDATFSIYRNAGLYSAGSVAAASYKQGDSQFWLSGGRPTDFFAVRVYDRVLTVGELMQNRAADLALYYGLTLSLAHLSDESLKAQLVKALEGATFELDADAKAAKKVELQAAIDAIAPAEKLDGLADMYVTDGLTALYTAFAGDAYVDLENGTWTDRVSGAVATLGNKQYWTVGANGGVSNTQIWGSYIDGTFSATGAYNNADVLGTRLDFGIDQLPYDDYTVEYVAQYRNIMAADANGNPVEALVNIADATWPGNTSSIFHGVAIRYAPIDQLGNLMNLTNNGRDKDFAGAIYGGTYATVWKNTESRAANVWNGPAGTYGMSTSAGPWQIRNTVATFEISRVSTAATYNEFSLTRDGVIFGAMTDKARNNAAERAYDNDYFYLGERLSMDFFAVRIYDRALTAEEREQNHFVDILLYYGLEIPEETLKDENAMANIKIAFASERFVTDAAEYASKKAQLQNVITPALAFEGNADLYVKDGLTALYTAFAGDTYVDLEAGTWTDRVSGATATLGNKAYWATGANGGVGVTQLWGSYIDGVFTETVDTNTFGVVGTRLEFGIGQLPYVDYTVEYVANYGHIMAVDAQGNPVQAINTIDGATWPSNAGATADYADAHKYNPVDQLGNLMILSLKRDYYNASPESYWGGMGQVFGKYAGFRRANMHNLEDGLNYSTLLVGGAGQTFYNFDAITTYEFNRDTVSDTEHTVAMVKGGSVYKSVASTVSSAEEHTGGNDFFYLGERLSVDFYAVRVYNRVLTAAERQQNHFVDIVLYYGLTIDEYILEDEALLADVKAALANETFVADEAEYAAKKVALQKIIDNDIDLGGNANLYVTKGLVAMFTAFAGDEAYVDLENGTWTDRVSGTTAYLVNQGETQLWTMNAKGGVGFNVYAGEIDDAGTVTGVGTYDTIKKSYRRLDFDVALLPTADFTVEYLAMYRPVYVADKEASAAAGYGVPATDASGNPLASWQYEAIATAGNTYSHRDGAVGLDVLGNFVSFQHRTTIDDAWGGGRNATRWSHGVSTTWSGVKWTDSWNSVGGLNRGTNDPFQLEGEVVLYSLVRDETTTDTGISASFALYQNNALYKSKTWAEDAYKDGEADFWLSAGRPTDFYTVRIYNRVLTAAENQQNHLADVVLYYGANIPENMLPGGDKYEQLATALGGIGFVTDEVERAAMSLKIKATIRDIEKNSDLLSLYVQDNLVGLFTALNSLDNTAAANGTWANRVYGGGSAQFIGGRWVKNVNGSVGTTQIYGMYDTETETWTAESEYNTVVAGGNGVSTRLLFDASLLNAMNDDYTLEYVAQYRPLMSVDANGTPVAETYVVGTVPTSGGWGCNYGIASPVDQVGFLRAFTTGRDANNQGYGRNVFSFSVNPRYDGGAYGWGTAGKTLFNFGFYSNDQVVSYAVIKDENDAHTAATYSMVRNGAAAKTVEFAEGKYDFTTPEANASSAFYLADYMSVDFFAVRIYSDVLTAYEMAQNKAIDIAYYYALTIPEKVYTDSDMLAALISALSDAKIVTDTAERAALKAEYQARLDNLEVKEEVENVIDYNSLYVQDGLVGLYTAFAGGDSVDVMNGTWANAIDNTYGAATLRGASFWKRGTVGVGYTIESVESYAANATSVGINLPAEFEDLENFTVEAFATAKGITNADGSRYEQPGAVYAPYTTNGSKASAFRFGMLNALFFAAMNPGNADSTRFCARWYVSNWSYPGYVYDTKDGEPTGLGEVIAMPYTDSAGNTAYDDSDQGWRRIGPMYVPTAGVMQVSKVTDVTGDVTYAIHYNNEVSSDDKVVTIDADTYATYAAVSSNGGAEGRFSLFTALPADVYAIRVYNRTLTDAEKLQNNFVDKAGFYQIDLSEFASVENKTEIYEYFAEIGTDLSKEAAQAIYDMKVNGGTTVVGGSVLKFQKYLPILNGAYGYRVLFEVSEDSVAMIEDAFAGYSVHYGAIVAPASSNTVENLTINGVSSTAITTSATNGQVVVVGGDLGSNIFYNYTDIGMGKLAFSVAVTASDAALFGADMIVRAFVTITNENGAIVGTYYDEAVENEMLDGTVSIATAADYFVNEFEGDAATEYEYMNAATLREVLKASGRDVTRVVANDLTLYVDPANGSDGNDGESLENAFATLDKAYAVTKAHLAQIGVRNVTIYLEEGTHYISETFALNADEINADAHSVKIVGNGAVTISSAQPIDMSGAENYDGDVYFVQLPKVDGKYPLIRDLVGIDTSDYEVNFAMSAMGNEEDYVTIQKVEFTDGETVYDGDQDLDWKLSKDLADTTTEAILYVNASDLASDVVGAEIHFSIQWCFNIMHVKSVEYAGGYAKLHIDYSEFKSAAGPSTTHNLVGDVAWFENGKGFLGNGVEEFAYDHATGTLYFDLAGYYLEDYAEMRVSTLDKLFALNGVTNFSIENVTMTGYADRSYEVGVGNGFGQSGAQNSGFHMAAGIYAENIDGLTVKNVNFLNADAAGIAVQPSAKNVIIDSNRFENLGNSAIIFAGTGMSMGTFVKNVTITNNYINEIGNTVNSASAIVVKTAANTLIAHNTITNVPYTGISVGWNWDPHGLSEEQVRTGIYRLYNVEVAYNYIANYMLSQHDGGAIYTLGGALTKAEAKQVNFVHHNYVNITAATGEHKGNRFFAAYYHDGGSSNWYNYSNVLMNSKNSDGVIDGLFGPYFVQYNPGNDGYNNQFKGNYAIGFKNNASVFNDVLSDVRFSAERGNYAEAYAYTNVANLNANNAVIEAGAGDRNCHLIANPNANAAAYVYSVFAAAGSTYGASTKVSGGLTVTASAIADEIRLTEELTNASDSNTVLVTFNDGTTSFTVPYAVGDALRVPAEFDKAGFSYVFTIGGETVADLTIVEVTGAITVNVAVTASIQDVVVTDGVTTQVYEVSAGDKIPAEALSGFAKEGYSVIYTIDGEIVDINNFTIGAEGVEIWAQYVKNSYTVTFTDGETVVVKTVPYGDKVTVPASYVKYGHATKATYGELDVTNGYNVPAEDITINVYYVAKDYSVNFYDEDGTTLLNTVTVTFGQPITAPEAPANKVNAGYVNAFNGWKDFTDGQILETEGLNVVAEIFTHVANQVVFKNEDGSEFETVEVPVGGTLEAPEGTPVKAEDETYTYTFAGWEGFTPGMMIEEPTSFTATFDAVEKAPAYEVGDLNGDTYIDAFDVALLIKIAAKTVDESEAVSNPNLNGDEYIDAFDVAILIKLAAKTE